MEEMSSGRLSEAIAFQIAELILSGQIESGTKLRQEELAKMLEVSRIPVREALQLLETQGLAKRLVTRHIVTADLDDVHVRETYAMIAAMEKNAIDAMVSERGLAVLQEYEGIRPDMEIHRMIIQRTANLYVQTLLTNAVNYYVQFAEKRKPQSTYTMHNVLQKWATEGESLLNEHYRILAETIIAERKKNYESA